MKYSRELKTAFKISIPVMMGYTVLGFAFGLLLVSFGYDWYFAPLMSLFIYAGALQFVAINFFNVKAGLIDIAIASWFVNLRQSFYGLSLLKRFKKTGKLKPYLIFALTDETYALLTTIKDDVQLKKRWYYFFLCALNQSYWFVGSTFGAILGANIKFDTAGLEFSLTALFVVLCIEQYKNLKNRGPFIIGAVTSIFAFLLVPTDKMLITAIVLSLILLFIFKRKVENE
ncbi:AzlC family ABC transporter permease [Halarcobacter ebronensis]|uniref:Branched-chain amino acid transporter AzlC n=1 Tax=Halarcobacter ebronensis TaxID=1462615 RepID=A0A4Q1AFN7_9BACT|nr:AzlC family ABC transporter permease [Halarcobacter ebronensis]QKF83101.1 branched-chain amino acid transport protein, AzlC family [Halarcobacter ebronensis]RXK01402.1 branched-chain amino acid transporter AzlC [Halarcobacter ebronensis]